MDVAGILHFFGVLTVYVVKKGSYMQEQDFRTQVKPNSFWCKSDHFDCKDNRLLVVEDEMVLPYNWVPFK